MTLITQYQVRKDDLHAIRAQQTPLVAPAPGEALLAIDQAAFTANNISYALTGESLRYWAFFPPLGEEEDWGVIPVWGFATVLDENDSGLKVGERIYGYFPLASHLYVVPSALKPHQFRDDAAHRRDLPAIYNSYIRVAADPSYDPQREAYRSLLFPLVGTSYGLFDWLEQGGGAGASQVVLTSASSKTALGLAWLLKNRSDIDCIGLTSSKNLKHTQEIDLYTDLISYDDLEKIPDRPTVIVDMAGNGPLAATLHQQLGDKMLQMARVGATHAGTGHRADGIRDDRTFFFFMPAHAAKRQKETDGAFLSEMMMFSKAFAEDAERWLEIITGPVEEMVARVRDGAVSPREGVVLQLGPMPV